MRDRLLSFSMVQVRFIYVDMLLHVVQRHERKGRRIMRDLGAMSGSPFCQQGFGPSSAPDSPRFHPEEGNSHTEEQEVMKAFRWL